jgi:Cu(I)/Ag(I) efflux system membrane fusion protein
MKPILQHLSSLFTGLALTATLTLAHGEEFTPAYVDSLVPGYLQLQTAFANDDLAASQKAARDLHTAALRGPKFSAFTKPVHAISTAADLKSARTEFLTVSMEMVDLIDHVGTTASQPLFLAHCPMAFDGKGGDWVQGNDQVNNPYYGAMMLRCGSIIDQIAGSMPHQEHHQDDAASSGHQH